MNYTGITHALPLWLLPMWKKIMCKRNVHVFDEVESIGSVGDWYLVCDACGLCVSITRIFNENEYCDE